MTFLLTLLVIGCCSLLLIIWLEPDDCDVRDVGPAFPRSDDENDVCDGADCPGGDRHEPGGGGATEVLPAGSQFPALRDTEFLPGCGFGYSVRVDPHCDRDPADELRRDDLPQPYRHGDFDELGSYGR